MIRGEIPRLFSKNDPTKFRKTRKLSHGSDIALFTSGICTEESLLVTNLFKKKRNYYSTSSYYNTQTLR
ncbi:MAG: hypothetical protein CM1200mP7_2720 [Chloroflexota bacterium]|nr:MAG: hypothetical protein CM1200mP7_2720 [Chloroflexota bacterium]